MTTSKSRTVTAHGIFNIIILRDMGTESVVITSAKIKGSDSKSVVGYDHKGKNFFKIDFDEIPVRFPGTVVFVCPDVDTLNVYKFERVEE